MRKLLLAACAATSTIAGAAARAGDDDALTRPIQLEVAAKWNAPQEPARVFGHTYYVGVAGLSAILIRTGQGLILLDGDLPQSVPLIEANIAKLGLRVGDIKFILNSHAHYDHAGGIAALARDSGATVVASPSGAAALRAGHATPDDPQAGYVDPSRRDPARFPPVTQPMRELRDGDSVTLGDIVVTAHFTPGHTPGSTTWSWRDCEGERCLRIVYADSLNAVSAPGFHFLADATHPDLTPRFRKSIQSMAALPCDILLTVHPDLADIPAKLQRLRAGAESNTFVDPSACRRYAHEAETLLDARIAEEQAERPSGRLRPAAR